MKHVLFIVGRNRLRSPTAEAIFADWPGVEVASAGLSPDADSPVTDDALQWAVLVFVMDATQRRKLSSTFRASLRDQKIVCLNIPDRYGYLDPVLIQMLMTRVAPHLPPKSQF